MSSIGDRIAMSIRHNFILSGVDVLNIDFDNEILTLSIPKDSYEWHLDNSTIKTPEDYAKQIKEKCHELGIFKNGKVRYTVKDIVWTKEMSHKAWDEHVLNGGY